MQTQEKLEWVPFKFQRLRGSAAYREPSEKNPNGLWDFQFGWYMKAIVEALDNHGYIPNDQAKLWVLCGARSKGYFLSHGGMKMIERHFPSVTADGSLRYQPAMINSIREQLKKKNGHKTSSEIGNLFFDDLSLSSKEVSFKIFKPEELQEASKRLFDFYLKTFRRDARYKLTPTRMKKCELRLIDLAKESNSLEEAEKAAREAIQNLAASEFHVSGGYYDWIDHLFGSTEIFQKRLAMVVAVDPKEQRLRALMSVGKGPELIHGKNCVKAKHDDELDYMHAPDDDNPFLLNGERCCGRCHRYLEGN